MLAGMVEPSGGEILIDDHPLEFGDYSFRSQRIRMIFQDPSTSLNPRQRISQIPDFPLRLNTDRAGSASQTDCRNPASGRPPARPCQLLPAHAGPGPKQRLGLARALILRPKVIIADEALASLDMSMRSQLINLMLELQEKQDLVYLRDSAPGMMKHISDRCW